MNASDIVKEIQEKYSEYFECVDEPRDLLVSLLANQLAHTRDHVQYLERRLKYVSQS